MIPGHWLQPTAHYRLQPALLCLLWLIWGALAHADPFVATSAAVDCLEMFDKQQQQQSHGRPGSSSHAQSRRFLDPKWQRLPDGACEEPLRPLVEGQRLLKLALVECRFLPSLSLSMRIVDGCNKFVSTCNMQCNVFVSNACHWLRKWPVELRSSWCGVSSGDYGQFHRRWWFFIERKVG
jgi:hypothetical protein